MIEILVVPEGWSVRRGGSHEESVFRVGDLGGGEEECIDPDAVDGTFAILAGSGAHEKPACGDGDEGGLEGGSSGLMVRMSSGHDFSLVAIAWGIHQPPEKHVYEAEDDRAEEGGCESADFKSRSEQP